MNLLGLEVPVQVDLLDRVDGCFLNAVMETLRVAHGLNVGHCERRLTDVRDLSRRIRERECEWL